MTTLNGTDANGNEVAVTANDDGSITYATTDATTLAVTTKPVTVTANPDGTWTYTLGGLTYHSPSTDQTASVLDACSQIVMYTP